MHDEDVVDFDTSCQFGQFKKWGRNNARQKYKTLLLTLKTMKRLLLLAQDCPVYSQSTNGLSPATVADSRSSQFIQQINLWENTGEKQIQFHHFSCQGAVISFCSLTVSLDKRWHQCWQRVCYLIWTPFLMMFVFYKLFNNSVSLSYWVKTDPSRNLCSDYVSGVWWVICNWSEPSGGIGIHMPSTEPGTLGGCLAALRTQTSYMLGRVL